MAKPKTEDGRRILATAPPNMRPDFKRPEYVEAQTSRDLCDALMEGTSAIRKGGELYLAKWPAEKPRHYEIRRKIARVTRYYKRIVDAVAGMINASPAKLAKGAHATLQKWADDVDGQNTGLAPFAHQVTTDAANGGWVAILVDYPSMPKVRRLRLDEEDKLGLRPFMVRIPAERIPSWLVEVPDWNALIEQYVNGLIDAETALSYAKQIIVRQVVIHEPTDVVLPGAFGATVVDRYRVLRLTDAGVVFVVWEHRKPQDGGEYFTVVAEGRMMAARKPLREIPLAIAYGGRKVAPFVAEPPMLNVAELNLDHHNITSDRRYLMRLCHAPTLFLAGFEDEEDSDGKTKPIEVGPNSLLRSSNPDAKASYVAADPTALDSSQVEKREVVLQIQAIGMAFIGVDRKTSDTATGRMLDDAAENANIATMSVGVKDGLEQAWKFMAMHRGLKAPAMEMKTSYASPRVDPQIATVLWNAVAADKLDVQSWLDYIKTGELPEDLAHRVDFLRVQQAKGAVDDVTDLPPDDASVDDAPTEDLAA